MTNRFVPKLLPTGCAVADADAMPADIIQEMRDLGLFGLSIAERVPLVVAPNEHNARYLATKAARMGHDYQDAEGDRSET